MVSIGTHRARVETIEPCRIRIQEDLFETDWTDFAVGDELLVMFQFNQTFRAIEKITESMVDENTLVKKLDPKLVVPATGVINSVFGPRRSPIGFSEEFHEGIDISGKEGSPIHVIESGEVIHVQADEETIYGYHIRVRHDNQLESIYGHLSEIQVQIGQRLNQGQIIGLMGNTGKSSGPHLHLGLEYHGKYLNPRVFYPGRKIILGHAVVALEA